MGRSLRVVGLARPGEVAFFSYLGSRTGLSSAFLMYWRIKRRSENHNINITSHQELSPSTKSTLDI